VKEVNILGTTYYLEIDETDLLKNINADGLHKKYAKKIIVRKLNDFLDDSDSVQEKKERAKEVLRHEIIHAFFSAAGLDDYCANEQLVNWLAIQFQKIKKVVEETEAIYDDV
jgi:hypothetical protein